MRNLLIFLSLLSFSTSVMGADTTKISTSSEEISENFDLKAVASAFGEAKDLEEFEKMLNDPEKQLSNLDLSGDGDVDYLRVMETVKGNTHYIAVQAVIGEDKYQDVCSIELEKDEKGKEVVQVVGDEYIYGVDYIYQPVYTTPPVIYVYFWAPVYSPWRSPWYWGYHPPHFHPWHPHPVHVYHKNVTVHVSRSVTYSKTTVRYSSNSVNIHNTNRRNDYGKQYPNSSHQNRNRNSVQNGAVTTQNRSTQTKQNSTQKRAVQNDWKPSSDRATTNQSGANGNLNGANKAGAVQNSNVKPAQTKKATTANQNSSFDNNNNKSNSSKQNLNSGGGGGRSGGGRRRR